MKNSQDDLPNFVDANESELTSTSKTDATIPKMKPFIIAVGVVAALGLTGLATYAVVGSATNNQTATNSNSAASTASSVSSSSADISKGGTYNYSGNLSEKITVDTSDDVTIVLNNVTLSNTDGACIKSKGTGKLTVVLEGENTLKVTGTEDPAAAISGEAAVEVRGDGSLTIESTGKGIKAETSLVITSGTYKINAADDAIHTNGDLTIDGGTYTISTEDDALHADSKLVVNKGTFIITAHEAIEATWITINDGTFNIDATDDAMNAAQKVDTYTPTIEINGGNLTVKVSAGDTDAIDSNGDIIITGGTLDITAQSAFDYDGKATFTGGTITVNGEKVTTITNQMMGRAMGGRAAGGAVNANEATGARPNSSGMRR